MKTGYIYKITSPTGRIYIGQTINLNGRIASYKSGKCNIQRKLYNSICKYGWSLHEFEILVEINSDDIKNELNEKEVYWIKYYNSNSKEHLNCKTGGLSGLHSDESKRLMRSRKVSKETKEKISISLTGHKATVETKNKLSKIKIGTKLSKETKDKISKSKNNLSESTRQKFSDLHKGKKVSKETKKKLRTANLGKKLSEETKNKIRMSRLGKTFKNEN